MARAVTRLRKDISIRLTLLRMVGFWRLAESFLLIFGVLWLAMEPAGLFFPDDFHFGWWGYGCLVGGSLVGAITWRWPRRSISADLSAPDTTIEVKVGDLFDEPGHLVIGTNDVFDTELGEVIKPASVQGQFLSRFYEGDSAKLDAEVGAALAGQDHLKEEDHHKPVGKQWRYPVGTCITLGTVGRRFFLTAYGRMGSDLKCSSDADTIWLSLSCLWQEVRRKGQGMEVATPILGSDLARTGLPRTALLKMIVLSFVVASKREPVTKKLTIMVHPRDLDRVNLYDLEDFLRSACF